MSDNYEDIFRKCIVNDCNIVEGWKISLFHLPKDVLKLEQWLSNVQRLDLLEKGPDYCYNNRRICALHFEPSQFTNILQNKLKKIAVPSKICVKPKQELTDVNTGATTSQQSGLDVSLSTPTAHTSVEAFTQTPTTSINAKKTRTPCQKHSLKCQTSILKQIEDLQRNKPITSAQFLQYCRQKFNTTIYHIVKAQEDARITPSVGITYTKKFKQFALRLYFLDPTAYISLSLLIHLPTKSCLMQITKTWKIETGFTNNVALNALQLKTEHFSEEEKECILCADEMPLKQFLFYNRTTDTIVGFHHTTSGKYDIAATKAVIFMARGIKSRWKQPIAYFFVDESCSAQDLKLMLKITVLKLFQVGLKVRCFVTDQSLSFYKLYRALGVKSELAPYFFVEDHKIFYLFDVSHLLILTRNAFLKYDLKFANEIISIKHIRTIWEYDRTRKRKVCPTLTESHLNPLHKKVELAAQLLSHSVALCLDVGVACNLVPYEAVHTANFVGLVDKLFKALNRPFSQTESEVKVFEEAKHFFSSVKIIDGTNTNVANRVRFLYGWKVTINAVEQLFNDLKCQSLNTQTLSRDCLVKFGEKICKRLGNLKKPSAIQFQRAFKKLFCSNLMDINFNKKSKVEEETMLINFDEADIEKMEDFVDCPVVNNSILENDSCYINLELPEENVHEYICGFLLYKCLKVHTCDVCKKYAHEGQTSTNERMYRQFKVYEIPNKDIYRNLCFAPQKFSEYVNHLNVRFDNIFSGVAHFPSLGLMIKNFLKSVYFHHPCSKFPHDYLLSLFVRFKIYRNLKVINRKYKDSINKRAKLKNLMNW